MSETRVVEYDGGLAPEGNWRLTGPVFRVGWAEGEPDFELIRHGAVADDGSVVVSDVNGSAVYVFEADGSLRHRLSGPDPDAWWQVGPALPTGPDRVVVQEGRPEAGLAFFHGGDLVDRREVSWGWRTGRSIQEIAASTPDGGFITVPGPVHAAPEPTGWLRAPVLRVGPDLGRVEPIITVDHVEILPREDRNPVRHWGAARVGGCHIVYGRNDLPELTWYELDGTLAQVVRWEPAAGEVTDDHWKAYEARQWSYQPHPEISAERLETMLATQREAFRGPVPAFRSLVADTGGNAWLSEEDFSRWGPGRHTVVDIHGGCPASVEMPPRFMLLAVTGTHVLGVEHDEVGTQAVALYEIAKD